MAASFSGVKVLIFLEVGRIIWNFFRDLIDAIEFCVFLKLIQVGCWNIWRWKMKAASFSGVKVLILQEVGSTRWNFYGEFIDAMAFCLFLKLIQLGCRNIFDGER